MRKYSFALVLLALILAAGFAYSEEAKVKLYFFRGQGCPHCADEEKFLVKLEANYPQLQVMDYEIYFNEENRELYKKMGAAYGVSVSGVPGNFIGDLYIRGFATEETTGAKIEEAVKACIKNGCIDAGAKGGIIMLSDSNAQKDNNSDANMGTPTTEGNTPAATPEITPSAYDTQTPADNSVSTTPESTPEETPQESPNPSTGLFALGRNTPYFFLVLMFLLVGAAVANSIRKMLK